LENSFIENLIKLKLKYSSRDLENPAMNSNSFNESVLEEIYTEPKINLKPGRESELRKIFENC
jgi:hypothetical protein